VLFEGEKVQPTTVQKIKAVDSENKEIKGKTIANSLFENLRKIRFEIAKEEEEEEEVPAYVIFSDAALRQMETKRPMSDQEFIAIDGVGKAKLEKYGDSFIKAIIAFQKNKVPKPKKENSTYKETFELYKKGLSTEAIALERKLGHSTIISHLAKLYLDGQSVDLESLVTNEEILKIQSAQPLLENPTTLKPYFDFFEEQINYDKIRIALAILEKRKTENEI
jgi:ATP-dependent DNA helicase RecQ